MRAYFICILFRDWHVCEASKEFTSIFSEPPVTDLTSIRIHLVKIYEPLLIVVTRSSCLTGELKCLFSNDVGLSCPVRALWNRRRRNCVKSSRWNNPCVIGWNSIVEKKKKIVFAIAECHGFFRETGLGYTLFDWCVLTFISCLAK